MASMSNYLENKLIDHIFRSTPYNKPTVIAIALCTAAPDDASTGATIPEVANSGSYARQILYPGDINWSSSQGDNLGASSGSSGITTNSTVVTFPMATGDWGTISHIAILDEATYGAGNVLFWGDLTPNRIVSKGSTFQFAVNQIIVRIDD